MSRFGHYDASGGGGAQALRHDDEVSLHLRLGLDSPIRCHRGPDSEPHAPGAGQRPPELAGRDAQLRAFDVVLERIAKGRPERSIVLTGLRGVGKTVLLNALRSAAVRAHWGTGKLGGAP